MKQYTIIYEDNKSLVSITKIIRIETEKLSHFQKSDLIHSVQYILEGHPKCEGEGEGDIYVKTFIVQKDGTMVDKYPAKEPAETKCLVIDYDILRLVFKEQYWNDSEDIVCVPTKQISEEEMQCLVEETNLSRETIFKAQYLIAE